MNPTQILSDTSFYWHWPELKHVYIDESLVLGVNETSNRIEFDMHLALLEGHKYFQPSAHGRRYSHKRGRMIFDNVVHREWKAKHFSIFSTAAGGPGDGIVAFFALVKDTYTIYGDWGDIRIRSDPCHISFE